MTIPESVEKIFLYTESFKDPDSFFEANEQMNFNASQILLLVIGEEVKKIDDGLKGEHKGIPWKEISKLRNWYLRLRYRLYLLVIQRTKRAFNAENTSRRADG